MAHFFECPNKPTSMLLECLLYSPVEAARFLGLEVGKEEDSDEVNVKEKGGIQNGWGGGGGEGGRMERDEGIGHWYS